MKNVVQIENVNYEDLVKTLGDFMGGNFIQISDIPYTELNAKQAAQFLGVAYNTFMNFVEAGAINPVSTGGRLLFALPQLFQVRTEISKLKYQRK